MNYYPSVRDVLLKHIDAHITTSFILQDELLALGIESAVVEAIPEETLDLMPLPKGKDYATYIPYSRREFYMYPVIEKIAEELPDTRFHIFSLDTWDKKFKPSVDNVIIEGTVKGKDKLDWIAKTRGFISLVKHGGIGVMLMEWLQAGRYGIANRKVPKCTYVHTVQDIINAIETINKHTEPNKEASEYYRKYYNPEMVRKHFKFVIENLE